MRPLILLACLILAPLATAENEKLPELKLKNGKTFTSVTVTKKTADGIAIMHESGTARIPFEQLPDDLAKTLGGFDPEKAAEARKATAASENAHFAEVEAAEAAQAAEPKKPEEKPTGPAKLALIKVMQAPGNGNALCHVLWVQTTGGDRWCYGHFAGAPEYIRGIGDVVDDQILSAALVPAENHTYTMVTGAKSTVKGWTVSGAVGDGKGIQHQIPNARNPVSGMRRVGGGD